MISSDEITENTAKFIGSKGIPQGMHTLNHPRFMKSLDHMFCEEFEKRPVLVDNMCTPKKRGTIPQKNQIHPLGNSIIGLTRLI
jgi:hypothetical protein